MPQPDDLLSVVIGVVDSIATGNPKEVNLERNQEKYKSTSRKLGETTVRWVTYERAPGQDGSIATGYDQDDHLVTLCIDDSGAYTLRVEDDDLPSGDE